MKPRTFYLTIGLAAFIVGISAHGVVYAPAPLHKAKSFPQPTGEGFNFKRVEKIKGAQSTSPIRAVDFANFSFPAHGNFHYQSSYTLRHGYLPPSFDRDCMVDNSGAELVSVNYGDVTGDDKEEAIVIVGMITGGASAVPHMVYIYTLRNKRPLLLWFFPTGDRAYGGVRDVYEENNHLVIELYGINLLPWEDPNDKSCGPHCCSCAFTRSRYEWHPDEFKFKLKGKPEVIYFDPDYTLVDSQ